MSYEYQLEDLAEFGDDEDDVVTELDAQTQARYVLSMSFEVVFE